MIATSVRSVARFRRQVFPSTTTPVRFNWRQHSSVATTCKMSKKKALIFLAPGAEEMEFVIAADVLRRGGIAVTVAGFPDASSPVKCSRDVMICADVGICDAAERGPYDVLVLPGGLGGAKELCASEEVGRLLKEQECAGRMIAAICAAPTALKEHKIGLGKSLTSYPAFEAILTEGDLYCYRQDNVVVDRNLVTSRGPGTAFEFALTIVKNLIGKEKACEVANAMLVPFSTG